MLSPNKDAESKKKYIRSLNFTITGIVNKVMPLQDEERDYGAIYLKDFTSNKGSIYECSYKNKYLFCKIEDKEAIIVTSGITEIKPNDSVIYTTNTLNYKVYRHGQLVLDDGIALNDDDDFYNTLKNYGYLDLSYYH